MDEIDKRHANNLYNRGYSIAQIAAILDTTEERVIELVEKDD
jgi:transposase-like protein